MRQKNTIMKGSYRYKGRLAKKSESLNFF